MKNAAKAAVFVMYPVIFYWPDLVQLSRRYEGCDKVEHMCSGDFFFSFSLLCSQYEKKRMGTSSKCSVCVQTMYYNYRKEFLCTCII